MNSNPADRQSLLKNIIEILQTHKRVDTLISTGIMFKNDKRSDKPHDMTWHQNRKNKQRAPDRHILYIYGPDELTSAPPPPL